MYLYFTKLEISPEETTINYFANFYDYRPRSATIHTNNKEFDPLDKVVELYELLVQAEKD